VVTFMDRPAEPPVPIRDINMIIKLCQPLNNNRNLHIFTPFPFGAHDMPHDSTSADAEFSAIHTVFKALEPLDDDARGRVINYIVARLEINAALSRPGHEAEAPMGETEEAALKHEQGAAPKYGSFAELYDAAQPKTNSDKALVAGYWLQVCQGGESFDGFSANKELKNLGQGLVNITNSIESLKSQKPALALQLKKAGTSQQARKTYKLTVAGIKAVEVMIRQ
jgi:hypothetical protein